MKKLVLLFFVLMLAANTFAQTRGLSAKALFSRLPAEFMGGTAKERDLFVVQTSATTNYLAFFITDANVPKIVAASFAQPQSLGQMKVYRGKTRTVVGLTFQASDAAAVVETTDTVKIITFLLEYKNGKWRDATSELLPKVTVDEAYKVLTEDFQMKNLAKENVRVEANVIKDENGVMFAAKVRGDESATTFKWFNWTGDKFVEKKF